MATTKRLKIRPYCKLKSMQRLEGKIFLFMAAILHLMAWNKKLEIAGNDLKRFLTLNLKIPCINT